MPLAAPDGALISSTLALTECARACRGAECGETMTSTATRPARPADLLDANAGVSAEDRQLQEAVAHFARQRLRPGIAEWFEAGHFPARELAQELGTLGVLGMHLEGYGCAGLAPSRYGLACLELEAGDSGAPLVRVGAGLAGHVPDLEVRLARSRSRSGCPGWPPGEAIGCFGLTEPDFGSDPAGMRTRASSDGGDWVLNGTKMWITNGSHRRRGRGLGPDRGRRSAASWCRPARPGFSAPEIQQKLSLRASVTSELVLRRRAAARPRACCPGPRPAGPAVLPERGPLRHRLRASWARPATAWRPPSTTPPTRESSSAGPIAGFQLTQEKLADMALELSEGPAAGPAPGPAEGRGHARRPTQVSVGKLNNVREAMDDRPRVPHDPRRQRHHAGVPGAPARQQPGVASSPTRAPARSTPWSSARP